MNHNFAELVLDAIADTSAPPKDFLNAIEAEVPAGKTLRVILDNYARHKHPAVRAWRDRHHAEPSIFAVFAGTTSVSYDVECQFRERYINGWVSKSFQPEGLPRNAPMGRVKSALTNSLDHD